MRSKTFITTAALAAVLMAAPMASAQGRQRWPSRGDNGNRGGSEQRRGDNGNRGGDNSNRGGDNGNRGGDNGSRGGNEQRSGRDRRAESRDGGRVDSPRDNARRDDGRDSRRQDVTPQGRRDGRYDGRYDGRNDGRYATPRTGPVPRYRDGDRRVYAQPRSNYYVYRYPSYRYYGGTRYYNYRYYDPYFAGDFFWSNHGWRSRSYYSGSNWDYDLGKLRLDIDQRDAEVYIDGYYAGIIDEFDGRLQGLRLEPGNYSVEVALPGFEPLEFDVHITPGRTTTYRGSLLPE